MKATCDVCKHPIPKARIHYGGNHLRFDDCDGVVIGFRREGLRILEGWF